MIKSLNVLFLALVVVASIGCGRSNPETASQQTFVSDTQEMIKRVNKAIDRHPAYKYLHANSARADMAKNQAQGKTGADRFIADFRYGYELHMAGKNDSAVAVLEPLCNAILQTRSGMTVNNRTACDILAVAYLRLGEEQNCCANHNPESCLMPLKGAAIHTKTDGSENAIRVYHQILSAFPNDLQSKYLLNIAYMTLGKYPGSVPRKWLLPNLDNPSEIEFPRFKDVAIDTKSDVMGLSGGVCLEDFNGDGLLDILCSSYGLRHQLRYLQATTSGTYDDRTKEAGLTGIVSGLNMVHGDYDNDGDADVLLLRGAWLREFGNHPNSLIRNNGDGTFDDVTISSGIFSEHPTQTACWADFNNDGYLDLFIGNEHQANSNQKHPCELFLNNGDGTFSDKALEAGVQSMVFAKGSAASDVNSDGLMDLFVSNLYGNNLLYINQGINSEGIPVFENLAQKAGVIDPQQSFPCWFFDYDNDGHQDLFVADYDLKGFDNLAGEVAIEIMGGTSSVNKPKLYRNNGKGSFSDVTNSIGLNRALFAMGSNFGDLNNDGFLDFYIGNGAPDLRMIVPNLMFLNENGNRYIDITTNGGFGNLQKGHAIAFGDVDGDGDQDIYTVMGGAVEGDTYQNLLFKNPGWSNKWLHLKLEGTTSNRSAIGARVEIVTLNGDERISYFHQIGTGGSFGSSSILLEAGLGDCDAVEAINVTWPNGSRSTETFSSIGTGRLYKLVEGSGIAEELPIKKMGL